MTKLSTLDKVARLDADIASLRARLDAKIDERAVLLGSLVAQCQTVKNAVAAQVQAVTHANALVTTGRILTADQVREIRRLHASGVSQTALGKRFGISQPSVFKIVRRQSYQDVA